MNTDTRCWSLYAVLWSFCCIQQTLYQPDTSPRQIVDAGPDDVCLDQSMFLGNWPPTPPQT